MADQATAANLIKTLDASCEVRLDLLVKDYNALAERYTQLQAALSDVIEAAQEPMRWLETALVGNFWPDPEQRHYGENRLAELRTELRLASTVAKHRPEGGHG